MESKFFSSLFEGESPNGVKLGMPLTGGEFWARPAGCQNLYRGADAYSIDADKLICVVNSGVEDIEVSHSSGESFAYLLRRANSCGDEEDSYRAVCRAVIDACGDITNLRCNRVLFLAAENAGQSEVRLKWYYSPIDQKALCSKFNVYRCDASGAVDYETVVLSVLYKGADVYCCEITGLDSGEYVFAVRAADESGVEGPAAEVKFNLHCGTVSAASCFSAKVI